MTSTPRTPPKGPDTSTLDRRRSKAEAAKEAADRAEANVAELDARLTALTTQTQQDQSALQRAQDEVTRLKRAVKTATKESVTLQARRKKASAAAVKAQAKAQSAEARYDEAVLADMVRRERDRDRAAAASATKSEQPADVPAPATSHDDANKDSQTAS